MRTIYILVSLMIAACGTTNLSKSVIGPANQGDVEGDWDIVMFDNFKPTRLDYDGGRNAYVNFGDYGTSYRLTCNFSGNSAVINDEGLLVRRPDKSDSMQTLMGCGKKREARDEEFFEMMMSSPRVERLPNERLRLTTAKHELILERAYAGQIKNAYHSLDKLSGKWNVAMVHHGGRGWGGSTYAAKSFVITRSKISYGSCFPVLIAPQIEEDAKIIGQLEERDTVQDKCEALTDAEKIVLKLIASGPIAEPTKLGDILLSNNDLRIVLTKDEFW